MTPPTVLLLAGEASGDAYGAAVASALRERIPDVRFAGIGGPCMAATGVDLLADLDRLAVMGFAEIVGHLEFFRDLERRVHERIWDADLVIPVDYPGFNLRAAEAARTAGKPVLYYVPPKVWAWRAARAKTLAACTNRVGVIFPFEVEILEAAGVAATFVGNPLLDRADDVADADAFHARWSLDPDRPIIAILPGSRRQELSHHLEPFLEAARLVAAHHPELQPVVSRAPTLPDAAYSGLDVAVVDDTRALLRHAHVGLVKSGTSTLEAALEGLPCVVAYRTSELSWQVVKRMLRVEHVSLPNLVAGEEVVPELIQDAMEPLGLVAALLPLLQPDGVARAAQIAGFGRVRSALGEPGAAGRVADLAVGLLEARA